MEVFELDLPGEANVSGRAYLPENTSRACHTPLIVCVHGGSYDSGYFDVDSVHSILSVAKDNGIPVVAIDRPGYGASKVGPVTGGDKTYAEAQSRFLDSTVLPALWDRFAERANATAIVLLGHSIGAMMTLIAAGMHTADDQYALAGVIVSGIGSELVPMPRQGMLQLLADSEDAIRFDPEPKDAVMLQWPFQNSVESNMTLHTARLNKPIPRQELSDINTRWLEMWTGYTSKITVPVMHGLGEFDGLWVSSQEAITNFKRAFSTSRSPSVRSEIIPKAPHCIELSLQSRGWYFQCCGFAFECAVLFGLNSSLPSPP